jgi:flap endonuclease-1
MGIFKLNVFLRQKCKQSFHKINLSELKNKKIAIDISIYLYKYADNLLVHIKDFLELMHQSQIIPIFIFDGIPPLEKKELLEQRKKSKKNAKFQYHLLNDKIQSSSISLFEKTKLEKKMLFFKKKMIYVEEQMIEKVKQLILYYGMNYIVSPNEAEKYCAILQKNNEVWGCMSDDTDMFVYGSTHTIRCIDIDNNQAIYYNMESILSELNLTQNEFREICIITGTDYYKKKCDIFKVYDLFLTYKNEKKYFKKGNDTFYHWFVNKNDDDLLNTYLHIDSLFLLNINELIQNGNDNMINKHEQT